MTFNPYAPPEEKPPFPSDGSAGDGPIGDGPPQAWSAEDVLRTGWETTKVHWAPLVVGPIIAGVIAAAPGQILQFAAGTSAGAGRRPPETETLVVVTVLSTLIGMVAQTFFQAGTIRLFLQAARGRSPEIAEIFRGGPAFFRLLGANILVGLAVLIGTLALIVPGVILALGFSMTPYYVVDTGMGPVEAMQASWRATTGHKGSIFVYYLLSIVVALLGLLACCVGILVSNAVVHTATAILFTRLSGRGGAPPLSPFEARGNLGAGPLPPPGGGWGAA